MVKVFRLIACVIMMLVLLAGERLDGNANQVVRKLATQTKGIDKLKKVVATAGLITALCLSSCDEQNVLYEAVFTEHADDVGSLPIMQGATTTDQTQFFILTSQDDDYAFSLLDGDGNTIVPATITDRHLDAERAMWQVSFHELMPATDYLLQVHSGADELLDVRELQTLDPTKQTLSFAFGSCMYDQLSQRDIWEQMVALNPDVIFLIGDNVYADTDEQQATPDMLWQRYYETRNTLNLFRNKQLIPVIAVWDDHDYGANNSDLTYPHKHEALQVFQTFFGSAATDNFQFSGIGVGSSFSIYGYDFLLLDDRTFRTPIGSTPQWHFGASQSQWLWNNLVGKDYVFLVSGDQFFGGYAPRKDSFQSNHPDRFNHFLAELKNNDTRVVFLSGDKHYTEIMAIPLETLGYQTYELTSSPLHANSNPLRPNNPLRLLGKGSVYNFMLVEASKSSEGLHLQATSYTSGGRVLFSGTYTVSQ